MATNTLLIGAARRAEMEALFAENDGLLRPQTVLEFARANPSSALYSAFTWDRDEAADRFNLIEAQRLIRRTFVVLDAPGSREPIRVHMAVSLPSDRVGRGYRLMSEVLDDAERRDELVRLALKELASFRKKFAAIQELSTIFAAIDEVEQANHSAA